MNHLLDFIRSGNPGILSLENISDLIRQAEVHLELIQRYGERGYILHGEVYRLALEFAVPAETLRYLLRKAGRPRIYYLLEQASMDERISIVDEVFRILNGVNSIREMDRRFRSLYFYREIVNSSTYSQYHSLSTKYFRFWREYLRGGLCSDIGKILGIGISTISEWLKFTQIPTHATYASKIPREASRRGWKWLPLRLNIISNTPESFIQVPERVTTTDDLLKVLEQIAPINTHRVKSFAANQIPLARHLEFMYLLGVIVSDGGFAHNIEPSAKVQLSVSMNYSWGLDFGRAFRHAMGVVGFNTERWADDISDKHGRKKRCIILGSEASPFFAWIENALLGLSFVTAKSKQSINADWILETPRDWRVTFIQGLADGDGHASISAFNTGIATTTNRLLIQKLFRSLGVDAALVDHHVIVRKQKEIIKAKKLPLFRYAAGRQKKLEDMCEIIKAKKRSSPSEMESKIILELHNKSFAPGRIAEILWYQYGIARSPGSIRALFRARNPPSAMN